MRSRHRPHRLLVALATTLTLLTACASPTSEPEATDLPTGISIDIYQSRLDASERKYEIAVTNSTTSDLRITRLTLHSPAYTDPMPYERVPATVPPARTIDFRVLLATPDCNTTSTTPSVTIEYSHNNLNGAATIKPIDRFNQLPALNAADCIASDVADIARLTFSDTALDHISIDGRDAVILALIINPTGVDEQLTLHSIHDTPLLALLDTETARITEALALDRTIAGTDPETRIPIAVVKSRCDQHSVADDKKGTHFPLTVTTPRRSGTLTLQTSEKTRSELFNYLARACGWG